MSCPRTKPLCFQPTHKICNRRPVQYPVALVQALLVSVVAVEVGLTNQSQSYQSQSCGVKRAVAVDVAQLFHSSHPEKTSTLWSASRSVFQPSFPAHSWRGQTFLPPKHKIRTSREKATNHFNPHTLFLPTSSCKHFHQSWLRWRWWQN